MALLDLFIEAYYLEMTFLVYFILDSYNIFESFNSRNNDTEATSNYIISETSVRCSKNGP